MNSASPDSLPQRAAAGSRFCTDARIGILLTPQERASFFPDGFGPAIEACRLFAAEYTGPLGEAQLRDFLLETRPEVLLGCWSMPMLSPELLAECPQLRYLCYVTGSLSKKIPRSFIEQGGYASNWGDEASGPVAECALMLGLMCLRKATRFQMEMHVDRSWKPRGEPRGVSLFNRRVGIYGFGAVARKLIDLLRPFNVSVEAFSAPVPPQVFADAGVQRAPSLKELFKENDVVFVVEALTEDTRLSVDAEVLGQLRDGAVLVNVGRGAVIDEQALADLARTGRIDIGLDVYAPEPLSPDSPLRGLRNAALLPHTAGPTIDCYPACGARAVRNLEAYLQGVIPPDHNDLRRYDLAT